MTKKQRFQRLMTQNIQDVQQEQSADLCGQRELGELKQ